jgi:hypothetical protein
MRVPTILLLAIAGCGHGSQSANDASPPAADLTFSFPDLGGDDGTGCVGPPEVCDPCGDGDPGCRLHAIGPGEGEPFGLPTDKPADPNVDSGGVGRDKDGYLTLDSTHASFDYLWLGNASDWSRGTLTKLDSKTVREVARYFTVTCSSNPSGSTGACDGMSGCCARDSYPQWLNRKANQAPGPAQQVQLNNNYPSRTAVDFNGDVWVANRAFGGQSSVTKIANDTGACIDRNKNGKIDTSTDANGDGVIQTDCNGDGTPDDILSVKQTPCLNGFPQEFFGLDDECLLFTTNTNVPNKWGRPLALGPGAQDFGPSDAWAGTYLDAHFFRIDGTSGLTRDEAAEPNGCTPYGAAIDGSGIGWTTTLGPGPVCWFNTKNVAEVGAARDPQNMPHAGYGISLDRDQNVWTASMSSTAFRYTPDRTKGVQNLGNGTWTTFTNVGRNNGAGGITWGIALDSRTANQYWAWIYADTHIVRMPASDVPLPKNNQDVVMDGANFPATRVAGGSGGRGVGVDRDQNIWGISISASTATRIKVDQMGTMAVPDLNSPPMGNNLCPAGDRCPYADRQNAAPGPYTYSDFTGFGLRNFTRPKGYYRYTQKGCVNGDGAPDDTRWVTVHWDADTPLNTSIAVRARSGNTPAPDQTWGAWTADFLVSPADLVNGMPLTPNMKDDGYLQVEFSFTTMDRNAAPRLKAFDVRWECPTNPG